uniref:Uncharacterized protein n=1 Tax=Anguilla anguilla TaxID=7936 RepID=A0A0E9RRI2_ANGAN
MVFIKWYKLFWCKIRETKPH